MAGLKITSEPSGRGQNHQLAAAEAALNSGRAIATGLARILDYWQYALDRAAFLKNKIEQESERFHVLEIGAILTDLDEQAAHLTAEITENPAFELPQLATLALTAKDFGVSAASLCAKALEPEPAAPQPPQQLRVASAQDEPAPAQLTVQEGAAAHLEKQRRVLAAAEAKLDAITSQAQVFAENLSAARSHLSARRYGAELTKITAEQMHARATTAAAAIGGLHRVDDGIFWGE